MKIKVFALPIIFGLVSLLRILVGKESACIECKAKD